MHTLLLASQSPRRLALLRQVAEPLGMAVETCGFPPGLDPESLESLQANEPPRDYVARVTRNKSDAAWSHRLEQDQPLHPLITGDTTVALDGTIFGKPADATHAKAMLEQLSGQTHDVFTAVGLRIAHGYTHVLSHSRVTFAKLPSDWVDWVVATGEPLDKAGAYAIQGHAGLMIERVEGSPSGIMGLPLFDTTELIRAALNTSAASHG
jgi:septum formation protein